MQRIRSLTICLSLLTVFLISGLLSARAAADSAENGWVEENGQTYYYVDGLMLRDCIERIDREWYAFRNDGSLLQEGETCTVSDGNDDFISVRAGWDGILLCEEWYQDPDHSDRRFYYGEDCAQAFGPTLIGDFWFLFDSDTGVLLYNQTVRIDGDLWKSDDYGRLSVLQEFIEEETDPMTGWVTHDDGGVGFVRDGEAVVGEILEIDGLCYYLDDNGLLLVNDACALSDSSGTSGRMIRAGEQGVLYRDAFYTDPDTHAQYYYLPNCLSAGGFLEMENGLRFFYEDGRMAKGETLYLNNQWIRFDDDGYLIPDHETEPDAAPIDGWMSVDGERYYYRGGNPISAGRHIIDWKEYCFGDGGRLLHDCIADEYLLDSEGLVVQEGPFRLNGELYYVNKDTHQILRNAKVSIDNNPYIADSDGHLKKTDSTFAVPEKAKTETSATEDPDIGYIPVNEADLSSWDEGSTNGNIWYSDDFDSSSRTMGLDAFGRSSAKASGSDNPDSGMLVWRGGEWTEVHGSAEKPIEIRIIGSNGAIMENEGFLRDVIICSPEGVIGYDQYGRELPPGAVTRYGKRFIICNRTPIDELLLLMS